jgi:asparagine synthetase B (glutamine-hydrolysing)
VTNTVKIGDLWFVHSLLSITGAFTPQPFVEDGVVCLYNGQLYNHPFVQSDGEVLIPLYRKHGARFPRYLDGEFAIALYDFDRQVAIFATDPFRTKPLFVNGIECASYRSGVGGSAVPPNTVLVKSLDGTETHRESVHVWDLAQQKDDYADWMAAFERAVAKRAKPGCFIGLSSGYDSGGIACALLRLGVEFKAYIYEACEHGAVLDERKRLVPYETFTPDPSLTAFLVDNVDNEQYTIVCDSGPVSTRVLDDGATLGLATIASHAAAEGRRVALSGQGADEILSDYSPWPEQSELKGRFPDPLRLWRNFNFGCQESYLMKEEYAGGAFGVESRYPFLDTCVVQEFLSLTAEAKNRHYKAPLREYLVRNGFPFEEGAKRGFYVR